MTILHAGGKFGKGGYKVSGGLHGVGISVVNALSECMTTRVKRDGWLYEITFERGVTGRSSRRRPGRGHRHATSGSSPTRPSSRRSSSRGRSSRAGCASWRSSTAGCRSRCATSAPEDEPKEQHYVYEGGIVSFVEWLNENKDALTPVISTNGEREDVVVECALQWTDGYNEVVYAYANNINTIEGGMHLTGFRTAVSGKVNKYARKRGLLKESEANLSTDDCMEGLTAIVSVKLREPAVRGPDQDQARQREVRPIVNALVTERLEFFLEENPKIARAIVEKCMQAPRAREAAKKARDLTRRKNALEGSGLPGKLVDCKRRIRRSPKMFLVEGDSAGGTAKGGRDRTPRPSCRCAARSSTSRKRGSTRCSATKRSAR